MKRGTHTWGFCVIPCDWRLAVAAETLGVAARPRPGTGEGIFLLLRMSKPVGPFQVHDWLMRKHGPLLDAQPKVWAIGTQSAIDAADRVLLAAAGVLQAAATINMDSVADRGADHRRIVGGARRSLNNGATYRERLFNLMTECSA